MLTKATAVHAGDTLNIHGLRFPVNGIDNMGDVIRFQSGIFVYVVKADQEVEVEE